METNPRYGLRVRNPETTACIWLGNTWVQHYDQSLSRWSSQKCVSDYAEDSQSNKKSLGTLKSILKKYLFFFFLSFICFFVFFNLVCTSMGKARVQTKRHFLTRCSTASWPALPTNLSKWSVIVKIGLNACWEPQQAWKPKWPWIKLSHGL